MTDNYVAMHVPSHDGCHCHGYKVYGVALLPPCLHASTMAIISPSLFLLTILPSHPAYNIIYMPVCLYYCCAITLYHIACIFGDPHIVTLDGHKYTFNGKGEFTLIETHDNSFMLQGRMEQAMNIQNNNASLGTVFTAIVAYQAPRRGRTGGAGRTVEFQVNGQGDLDILVDKMRVNFADLSVQDFQLSAR